MKILPVRSCQSALLVAISVTVQLAHGQPSDLDAASTAPIRPNVLFIAVDDLRCELGCYGAKHVHSPNIDKFASTGVTFTRAYVQQAVCNPSRVSIMTGLRPDTTKVWDLVTKFRSTIPDAVTLPQHFRKHGYYAVSFGKIFHNPWPDNTSWDEPHRWPEKSRLWSEGGKTRLADYRRQMRTEGKNDAAIRRMRAPATEMVEYDEGEHIDAAIADQAISALGRLAKKDQPFFLATGFVRPHLPFVVPKKYWQLYRRAEIPLADNQFFPRGMPPMAFGDRSRGGGYELTHYMDFAEIPSPFDAPLSEVQQRELKHGYLAAISFVDVQVGRLLDELERLDLTKDTIVVLWSDHGWKLGEHNGWCKQTNFEIDTRAPLIIRNPGAKANGLACHSLVEFVDIYPTLCQLADLPLREPLEGESLDVLLSDASAKIKDAAFSQFPRKHGGREYMGCALRTDRYRYVEWVDRKNGEIAARELYDHEVDTPENINAVDAPNNADVVRGLSKRLWQGFNKANFVSAPVVDVRQQSANLRPNILFLMADDWSWPHAGACGDSLVKTPTFDRIAREGVLFNNAHVSSPSCTPSRMAIAAGQYHWRLREAANLGGSLAKDVRVYPELLQAAGYQIGHARKGAGPSQHQYTHRDPFGPKFASFAEFFKQRKPDQPFCFWYGAGEPHRPYRYGEGARAGLDPAKATLPRCLPDNEMIRNDFADYLHRIQNFDSHCGKMVATLEEARLLENTIIVISGDNGMPFPRCKATLYDTGTHVPLAVRWGTNIKPGRRVDDFVSLTDLAPTFLEAARLEIPSEMNGRSLLPILGSKKSGQIEERRNFVITGMERHVYAHPCRAIRNSDFLYIRNLRPDKWPTGDNGKPQPEIDFAGGVWPSHEGAFSFNIDPSPTKTFLLDHRSDKKVKRFFALACGPRPREELYDLRADPGELHNLADNRKFSVIKAELRGKLDQALQASQMTGEPQSGRGAMQQK